MRSFVEGIFKDLVSRHQSSGHVHLNDIVEVIGGRSVTYDEVEHLIGRLEEAGLRVGEPLDAQDISIMRGVLASARKLRSSLGRTPTIPEIAAESGHTTHVVRRALEHGQRAASQAR